MNVSRGTRSSLAPVSRSFFTASRNYIDCFSYARGMRQIAIYALKCDLRPIQHVFTFLAAT